MTTTRGLSRHDASGEEVFDAIVVGGRIAGCATAIQLARQGSRVLVVDRTRFPQDTVSTHLMKPDSVRMLHRLGFEEELAAIDAPPLRRFRQDLDGTLIEGTFPAQDDIDHGYCIRRARLDHAFARFTKRQPGICFLEGCSASALIVDRDQVSGVVLHHNGHTRHVRSSVVIGADGRASLVAQSMRAPTYWRVPIGRAAYYGYFHGVAPAPEPTIEIFVRGDEWFYLFPSDAGRHLVAVGLPARRDGAAARESTFWDALRRCPELAVRLRRAALDGKVYRAYMPTAASYARRPSGAGWALVGDAGMYFDPVLGQGMGVALRSAEILAEEIQRDRRAGRLGTGPWRRYELRRNWEFWDLYAYTCWMSVARPLSRLEHHFYASVAKDPLLTVEYLAVASHSSRVTHFVGQCLRRPRAFLPRRGNP